MMKKMFSWCSKRGHFYVGIRDVCECVSPADTLCMLVSAFSVALQLQPVNYKRQRSGEKHRLQTQADLRWNPVLLPCTCVIQPI